jgi:hypothetical protein
MRRNSGYTRSASRPRAASSPPLQAFNKAVISAEDPSIDSAFFPRQKIYQTVAEFAEGFRLYQRTEDTLSEWSPPKTDRRYS